MKYLFIFVLILFACSDEPVKKCTPFEVIISDALPIQFWQADCDTYNEKEVCGVHAKCWCQPWNCDDEIPLQFTDTSELDYILRALDENGDVIFENSFSSYQQTPGYPADIFQDYPLSGWLSESFDDPFDNPNWALGTNPSVSTGLVSVHTDYIVSDVFIDQQTFTISMVVDATNNGKIVVKMYNTGVEIGSVESSVLSTGADQVVDVVMSLSDDADEIKIYIERTTGASFSVTLKSIETNVDPVATSPFVYSTSFIPSETTPGICNERIRLEIVNVTASPENVVAKSDCLDIKQAHACTNVIEYFNNLNLDGLIYEDISPVTTFRIRVPSIFFHEKFVEEDNVIKLTSSVVKTSSSIEAQRLFETDYIPYYMHRKLQLIFKHQDISIDNRNWVKREAYEIQEGERRWPLKKAKCYLNEDNYLRSVL